MKFTRNELGFDMKCSKEHVKVAKEVNVLLMITKPLTKDDFYLRVM